MSTDTILLYAIGVFTLMVIGIFLTTLEFKRLREETSQPESGARRSGRNVAHRGVDATDTA